MITLGNIKTIGLSKGIRIDRDTPVGNPFYLRVEADREAVCDAYEEYFIQVMQISRLDVVNMSSSLVRAIAIQLAKQYDLGISWTWQAPTACKFVDYLDAITKDSLVLCWCKPKRCHGHTIIKYKEGKLPIKYLESLRMNAIKEYLQQGGSGD